MSECNGNGHVHTGDRAHPLGFCPGGVRGLEKQERAASRAFGEGSDARVLGTPLYANPYPGDSQEGRYWKFGWKDVHTYWGVEARWPVRPLPRLTPGGC